MAYCTLCGKKLNDGEVCSCQQQSKDYGFSGQGFDFDDNSDVSSGGFDQGFQNGGYDENEDTVQDGTEYEEQWKTTDNSIGAQLRSIWVAFANRVGIGDPDVNDIDVYESDMQIVPECIDANEGEIPIKQYDMALLRSRIKMTRAEGRLQVTNKRLIFRAAGRSVVGRTTLQHEFSIEEIAGFEIRKDHRFSFLNLFLCMYLAGMCIGLPMMIIGQMFNESTFLGTAICVIFSIGGLIPFFTVYKKMVLKFACLSFSLSGSIMLMRMAESEFMKYIWMFLLIVAFILWFWTLFIMFFVPNLEIIVKTKGGTGSVEIRRKKNHIFAPMKPEYTGFSEVLPWVDTEMAIIEVGAMIEDIQNFGDAGIKKWKEESCQN